MHCDCYLFIKSKSKQLLITNVQMLIVYTNSVKGTANLSRHIFLHYDMKTIPYVIIVYNMYIDIIIFMYSNHLGRHTFLHYDMKTILYMIIVYNIYIDIVNTYVFQ